MSPATTVFIVFLLVGNIYIGGTDTTSYRPDAESNLSSFLEDSTFTFEKDTQRFRDHVDRFIKSVHKTRRQVTSEFYIFLEGLFDQYPGLEAKSKETIRWVCFCDGTHVSPCPVRCQKSCFCDKEYHEICPDSCSTCSCNNGTTECNSPENNGDTYIASCAENQDIDESCYESFGVHKTKVAYRLLFYRALQPLLACVRMINYHLDLITQETSSAKQIYDFKFHTCDQNDEINCYRSVDLFWQNRTNSISKMQRNLREEVTTSQKYVKGVMRDVQFLKEYIISDFNHKAKMFRCCLKKLLPFNEECNEQEDQAPIVPPAPMTAPMDYWNYGLKLLNK